MKKKLEKVDISKLKALVESGDAEGAKTLLADFFKDKLSSAERGEIYTKMISAGLEVQNKIDSAYLAQLKDIIASVKDVNASETQVTENLNLAKVRANLR